MNLASENLSALPTRTQRMGEALKQAAFVLLLAVIACRAHLAELPFSLPISQTLASIDQTPPDQREYLTADRTELARVTFILLIFLCALLWSMVQNKWRREGGRAGWIGAGVAAAFVVLGFLACWHAADKYTAFLTYVEQVSLLLAGWLVMQMCADPRRRAMVMVLLAALAGAMATRGLWQYFVEGPQRVADFEANRVERLAQMGWSPGSAQAAMIESRLRDVSPFGFLTLTNLFASLMILLSAAAVGLAGDKLLAAARSFRQRSKTRKPGEVDLPLLAGFVTALFAIAALVVLAITGSMGGMAAAGAAIVGGLIVWRFPARLRRHWGKAVLAVTLLFLLGAAAVVAYGLKNDQLPTKTMTFRWYYWSAAGEIIADRPLWGAGPGNFDDAYLQYRRPAAEEEVKLPHNALVHAVVQYGLPGGMAYLALLAFVLVAATRPLSRSGKDVSGASCPCVPGAARPRKDSQDLASGAPENGNAHGDQRTPVGHVETSVNWRSALAIVVLVSLAVFATRVYFAGLAHPVVVLFDGVFPALALAGFMLLAAWTARGRLVADGPVSRIALPAGLLAFALADMVSDAIWIPATAMIFWTAAGACLSRHTRLPVARLQALGLLWVYALICVGLFGWWPAWQTQQAREEALAAYAQGDNARAAEKANEMEDALYRLFCGDEKDFLYEDLSAATSFNADAQAQAAEILAHLREPPGIPQGEYVRQALFPANAAARLDLDDYAHQKLLAELAARFAATVRQRYPQRDWSRAEEEEALESMARAVELNPVSARLRVSYTRMLLQARRNDEALAQLKKAEWLESQLNPESLKRFTPADRAKIAELKRQVSD